MLAYKKLFDEIFDEVGKVIVGQQETITQILAAIMADGNALLEGYPGLAKTLTVRTLARVMDLRFSRIQNTPDLMPSDITGTYVLEEQDGKREFKFHPGPIFANVVLADEINRATPKTQSALLEAMQEKQVTVGNTTYKLEAPFFLLATQNPIEQEGVYPLPEAQSDRFLLKIKVTYPSFDEELEIVNRYAAEAT
ncbi:MAG TPA: AAA family ATPase [Candidatus Nanoarchaeia archaeon]|nr:AAA family ATPase [Candidatus Nanoarchaeia archaeon]